MPTTESAVMTTQEVANRFNELAQSGQWDKIQAELFIDSSLVEKIELPLSYTLRRYEMAWNYSLKPSKHTVELRFAAPVDNRTLPFTQAIIYTDKAIDALEVNKKGM